MEKHVLVTGGIGFIGSHTCIGLIESGYKPIILDNLCNSDFSVLSKIEEISLKKIPFFNGDVRDSSILNEIFLKYEIDSIIHFAALKSIEESISNPIGYFDNNVSGLTNLLKFSSHFNIKNIIFSSSATVYGVPKSIPIKEDSALSTTNPYGETKLIGEKLLEYAYKADTSMKIICLRYFNPVGAHISGKIGENPKGEPKNIFPYISRVASGKLPFVKIFGTNYPTHDGSGIRDYIHVMDLAKGHICALNYLNKIKNGKYLCLNLGSGKGYSVLEVIKAFQEISKNEIEYKIMPKRNGDIPECYADPSLAEKLLEWKASFGIEEMCRDALRYEQNNQ